MDYLHRVFQDMMLVLKTWMGDFWAPSSPDMNPCDFFLGGFLKELENKPVPANLLDLKERITREFRNLPEAIVAKAVFGMMKRSMKLLKTGGEAFEKVRM